MTVKHIQRNMTLKHVGKRGPQGIAGLIQEIIAGENITVDSTDPTRPIVAGVSGGVVDATALIKGKLKLAGDLGGTADTPLVKRTNRFIIAPYGDTRPADYTCAGPSDNHIEINQAIVAANALPGGADVELLDGYFELGSRVMRLPNVHIYGQGIKHTKVGVVSGANFTMFDMDKAFYNETNPLDNMMMADMEISGENMSPSSEKKAINGGNFTNSKLFRIWAHHTTATGIGDDDFYGCTIDQCLVTDCGYQNKRTFVAASWSSNVFTFETSTAHGYTGWATASGTLTSTGTISDTETVTIAGVVYTFKTTLSGAAFEVLIDGSAAQALTNLKAAVNLAGTIGVDYGAGTTRHPSVTAGSLTTTTLAFSASTIGSSGNSITTAQTGANISFSGATLSGGVSGNKIVIAGMVPKLYNGTFNVTTVPDSTHFTISSATNTTGLNFTIDPGIATTLGHSSDSILGHNGFGIASGALEAEVCIVTNSVAINNQNNNFLIEADNNNGLGNEVYIFTNCVSVSAGSCGFRNTGSPNTQFNNSYDFGSPIGGQAGSTFANRTITAASWLGGVITFTTSSSYLHSVGDKVTISSMVPEAYNGIFTVQGTPTSTTFTVNLASDPGAAVHLGSSAYEAHPVDGSSFNNMIFSHNLDYGLLLPDEGVTVNNPVIKSCYNYGARLNSVSNCHLNGVRIYGNGRQGISIIMGGGVYAPMDHLTISGHIYNNGQRFASCDGIDVSPSATSSPIQNVTLDVHCYDNQETKTQRYGVILRSGGTLSNVQVRGNLSGNATGPILVQNTSDSISVTDVVGVNPNSKKNMDNISGSTTFDVAVANTFIGTLTGNITAVMTTPPIGGAHMTWILAQDATGSRTLSLPANAASGTTLTLSTTAGAIDILNWVYDNVGGKWRLASRSMGNNGVGTLSNIVVTTPSGGNVTSAAITQNDTVNNPIAEVITNAGTNHGLQIVQNGVLGSSKYGLFIDSNAAQVNAPLMRIRQQNASSTQAALQLDQAGSGAALSIVTGNLSLTGGANIALSATTGTQIGTATSQKLGFYAATPIVQPGATTEIGTVLSNLGLRAAGTAYPITTSGLATLTGGVTISAGTLALAGATITNTGTLTLPTSTDTLVGRATTDTLTNKTLTSPAITTPTGIVKGDVGLGNVDNTSDANKPISTATQTALNDKPSLTTASTYTAGAKQTVSHSATTSGFSLGNVAGNPSGAVEGDVWYNSTNDSVSFRAGASVRIVATLDATQTLTNKTLTSPAITTPTGIVKGDVGLANVDNTSNATERAATATLTNKRVTKRSTTAAGPGATPSINTDNVDYAEFTGLAAAITSMTTNLTGTPTRGDTLWLSFTDNGTARAITWGASFESSTVALPTTTVINTRLDVGFNWNVATTKWRCVAVA